MTNDVKILEDNYVDFSVLQRQLAKKKKGVNVIIYTNDI